MKAVVLMAGKGTRWAKDFDGPKQLMLVNGKEVAHHAFDMLPPEIDRFVFVVGGPHEQTLREHFGDSYDGKKIEYVVQTEQLGLAHAFGFAKDIVGDERWLGMVSDDIVGPKGLAELAGYEMAVLAHKVDTPENFGVLVPDKGGYLVRAVEKPKKFVGDLVWTGHMVMDGKFFATEVAPSARGEYETPDVWMKLIEQGAKIKVVESEFWLPINDKAQLEEAEGVLSAL